jgi:cyclophilin family peptidyl-prolyl cis-trans isomerase
MLKNLLIALALTVLAAHVVYAQTETKGSPVNTTAPDKLVLETTKGKVVIALRPDLAPKHVERIKTLAGKGFYNGVIFHRVIAGFMAQTGDPTGTGTGGSEMPDLKAEFTDTPYVRGTVGAARTGNPDSANSQFFITFGDASFLNSQYTVWGQVIEGMDVVDKIEKGEPPANPDKITKAYIEGAAAKADTAKAPAAAAK